MKDIVPERILHTEHIHRPSLWGFLCPGIRLKRGPQSKRFHCKTCGLPLRICPSQWTGYVLFNLIPVILLFFLIVLSHSLHSNTVLTVGACVLLLLFLAALGVVGRIFRYEPYDGQAAAEQPRRSPAEKRNPP